MTIFVFAVPTIAKKFKALSTHPPLSASGVFISVWRSPCAPPTSSLKVLERRGLHRLASFGTWTDRALAGKPPLFSCHPKPPHLNTPTQLAAWTRVSTWLNGVSLDSLVIGSDITLAIPLQARRLQAEALICSHAHLLAPFRPSLTPPNTTTTAMWASDGSHVPGNYRSTASIVGPLSVAFSIPGSARGSLQAEVFGLLGAALLADQSGHAHITIYSDHLPSVRLIEDARAQGLSQTSGSTRMLGRTTSGSALS